MCPGQTLSKKRLRAKKELVGIGVSQVGSKMAAPNVADGRAVLTVCVQLSAVIGSIVCAVLRGKKPQEPVDGATSVVV